MARFTPRGPADLQLLRAGICPDCGASVSAGMGACPACRVDFGEHAAVLRPRGRPLSAEEIDDLERGVVARNRFPISGASVPDEYNPLALGGALSSALVVFADAALADDPGVLAGLPPIASHIPRSVFAPYGGGAPAMFARDAALVDDVSTFPPPRAPVAAPVVALPRVITTASDPASLPTSPSTSPAFDPDATMVHEMPSLVAAPAPIAARGRARSLDE